MAQHLFNHEIVDFPGGFTTDNESRTDLSKFDTIRDIDDAIQHPQTRIGNIVDLAARR